MTLFQLELVLKAKKMSRTKMIKGGVVATIKTIRSNSAEEGKMTSLRERITTITEANEEPILGSIHTDK